MKFKNYKKGYTIIETMVSVSLFVIVVVAGMATLLNANIVHNKSQNIRSIIDNLTFITEEISRNLKTGYNYHCVTSFTVGQFPGSSELAYNRSCQNGVAVAFENAYGDPDNNQDQWVYRFEPRADGNGFNLSKSTDAGLSWVQLNSNDIIISQASAFSVFGSEAPPSDTQQPFVFIRISGEVRHKNVVSPFSVQTMSSQRLLDVQI